MMTTKVMSNVRLRLAAIVFEQLENHGDWGLAVFHAFNFMLEERFSVPNKTWDSIFDLRDPDVRLEDIYRSLEKINYTHKEASVKLSSLMRYLQSRISI